MTASASADAVDVSDAHAFLRLLQLASPTLPIGAFAYSQGLEAAVTAALVTDEASASAWILGLLGGPVAATDLAVFARVHAAVSVGDESAAYRWNAFLLATRATAELQAEDRHLGTALGRVLDTLGLPPPVPPAGLSASPPTLAGLFARAAALWRIPIGPALSAFAFAWAEAQVSAVVRLVPLGQSSGVRILATLAAAIPAAAARARALPDDQIGGTAPIQAILSSDHETQYSRLFRS